MKEITGNLWDFYGGAKIHPRFVNEGWVCITTNGDTNSKEAAVMGRGIAKEAAIRFPRLPFDLGDKLQRLGNHVHSFSLLQLITFPVKHHWQEQADPELISRSVVELVYVVTILKIKSVYLPRPGCGNGRLKWEDVRPLLLELDDRFTVVEIKP